MNAFATAARLQKDGKFAEAAAAYDALLAVQPGHFDALYLSGVLALQLGDLPKGIGRLRAAIAANATVFKVHRVLAAALRACGDLDGALAACDYAIACAPTSPEAHLHRAHLLQELKRLDDALASYAACLTLNPENADAHFDRAHCLLLLGRLTEGYAEYEWRKKLATPLGIIQSGLPAWQGDFPIAGKTLLLYAEQGLGDTILYGRYARIVADAGARVILAVQPRLQQLMRSLSPTLDVRPTTDYITGFDAHCALMSLPFACRTSLATVPATVPYLAAETERVSKWKARIGTRGFRIGIIWQGSRGKVDAGRSFPLTMYAALAHIPSVRLISLQMQDGTEQLSQLPQDMQVETLGPDFDDGPQAFIDTAAAMQNLDLIVTSDTAVAHLAGALARPVWIGLKYVPGSFWRAEGPTTLWYPTARLFRQKVPGDWTPVFDEIAQALRAKLTS